MVTYVCKEFLIENIFLHKDMSNYLNILFTFTNYMIDMCLLILILVENIYIFSTNCEVELFYYEVDKYFEVEGCPISI